MRYEKTQKDNLKKIKKTKHEQNEKFNTNNESYKRTKYKFWN